MTESINLNYQKMFDFSHENVGKTVDWDMLGKPISDIQVLFFGPYSPFIKQFFINSLNGNFISFNAQEIIDSVYQPGFKNLAGGEITKDDLNIVFQLHNYGYGNSMKKIFNLLKEKTITDFV